MTFPGRPIYPPNPAARMSGQEYEIEQLKRRAGVANIYAAKRATFYGPPVTIADGASHFLDWGSGPVGLYTAGADIFDLTDPTVPVFVDGGIYGVTVTAVPGTDMTPGGGFTLEVDYFDCNYGQVAGGIGTSRTIAADLRPPATLAIAPFYVSPGGSGLKAIVTSHDGAVAVDFRLSASVQFFAAADLGTDIGTT